MEKELKRLKLDGIAPAAWNPRTEAELAEDHPAMKELVASVKAVGVIQPIDVWTDEGMALGIVLAGSRRVKAALLAGLKEIPAMVFKGITEAQAREITRIENEVRRGVDPMKDASLIGEMLGLGFTQKEIAARFGVSEAQICRRRKLLDLCPKLRERAESADGNITIDALERIAVYPPEIQEACAADIAKRAKQSSTPLKWGDVSWMIAQKTKDLDIAKFNTERCKKCASRTGAMPDLFGETKTDKLGSCLDAECYVRKVREWGLAFLRKKLGNVELVDGAAAGEKHRYNVQYRGEFGEKKSKDRPALWYWFSDYDGDVTHIFGPTLEEYKQLKRKRDEAAAKAVKKTKAAQEKAEAKEKARRALFEERGKLMTAYENARAEIAEKAWELVDYSGRRSNTKPNSVLKDALKSSIKSQAELNAVATILAPMFDNDIGFDDEVVGFCHAFPAFAKQCGIKSDDWKKLDDARKALGEFHKQHPEFDVVD